MSQVLKEDSDRVEVGQEAALMVTVFGSGVSDSDSRGLEEGG